MTSEQHILEASTKLFMRYGIKSITMDDVARELGISKKTLYTVVKDKRELVYKAVLSHFQEEQSFCGLHIDPVSHPLEQMLMISKRVVQHLKSTNPAMIFDIRRYYPKSWEVFMQHRNEFILGFVENNLRTGMNLGVYRSDIQPEIEARLYIKLMDSIADAELFPMEHFNVHVLVKQMLRYHLHAISTPEAIASIEQHFNEL